MQIQPIRFLRIVLSFAVFSLLCWEVAGGQQAASTDKPPEASTGVRLIDTTPDVAADTGAASAVRTASSTKSGVPTLAPPKPATDAALQPVEESNATLQPAPAEQASADKDKDNDKSKSKAEEKPADGEKGKGKLEPIPDPQQLGPVELEATSFHGVTPGVTTVEQMVKAWGAPRKRTSKASS